MLDNPRDMKIVVIGGGSGTSTVLRGLKHHISQLTAVVTMFDSGGSSGLLQKEFGYPPLGDLRRCLLGRSEERDYCRVLRVRILSRAEHIKVAKRDSLQPI